MVRRLLLPKTPAALLVVALALAALGWACGGGGSRDNAAADPQAKELLYQMVLTEKDVPAGVQQVSASFSTNQDIADAVVDPDAELAKLRQWGRRLGYDVQLEPGPEAPVDIPLQAIQSTASLYETVQGASASFADAASSARATNWQSLYPGVNDLEVKETKKPELFDDGVWFRITGIDQNSGKLVIDDQVAFRVSSARGFLRVVTLFDPKMPRDSYMDEVTAWIRLLTDRTNSALAAAEKGATATATP